MCFYLTIYLLMRRIKQIKDLKYHDEPLPHAKKTSLPCHGTNFFFLWFANGILSANCNQSGYNIWLFMKICVDLWKKCNNFKAPRFYHVIFLTSQKIHFRFGMICPEIILCSLFNCHTKNTHETPPLLLSFVVIIINSWSIAEASSYFKVIIN